MRRFVIVLGGACVASACAMIAGLDDPQSLELNEAGGGPPDSNAPSDATGAIDSPNDGGPIEDAYVGPKCTGELLVADSFDDRTTDASAGWFESYAGDGSIEISDGGLHVVLPATTTGNIRRQIYVNRGNAPEHMCATFTVRVTKPATASAFSGSGNTNYGFIAVRGPVDGSSQTFFDGIGVDSRGVYAHVARTTDATETVLPVPIAEKWHVYMNADFAANTLRVVINGREATFTDVRPVFPTANASFDIGLRNLGAAPEAEAYFDDVIVTAD